MLLSVLDWGTAFPLFLDLQQRRTKKEKKERFLRNFFFKFLRTENLRKMSLFLKRIECKEAQNGRKERK
jgi:hypothetical protein